MGFEPSLPVKSLRRHMQLFFLYVYIYIYALLFVPCVFIHNLVRNCNVNLHENERQDVTWEGVSKHSTGSEDGDIMSFQKHTTAIRVEAQQAGTESDSED